MMEKQFGNPSDMMSYLEQENDKLQAENEKLREALEQLNIWCKAYPIKMFPKPDLKKAHKVLKENGMTLDAISADNFRYVLIKVDEITTKALKQEK